MFFRFVMCIAGFVTGELISFLLIVLLEEIRGRNEERDSN